VTVFSSPGLPGARRTPGETLSSQKCSESRAEMAGWLRGTADETRKGWRCCGAVLPVQSAPLATLTSFWFLVCGSSNSSGTPRPCASAVRAWATRRRLRALRRAARARRATRCPPLPPRAAAPQGLLNNSPYVVSLALATEISSGGVGLVYLAAITPTILVKSTVSLVRRRAPPLPPPWPPLLPPPAGPWAASRHCAGEDGGKRRRRCCRRGRTALPPDRAAAARDAPRGRRAP
jgi:hypothetical protein